MGRPDDAAAEMGGAAGVAMMVDRGAHLLWESYATQRNKRAVGVRYSELGLEAETSSKNRICRYPTCFAYQQVAVILFK